MAIPIIGDIINAVKDVASEAIVDVDKKRELQVRLQELEDKAHQREFELAQSQIEVNKVEAGHRSIFVAGWRPAVGWVGVFALAYAFVLMPFMSFLSRTVFGYRGEFPIINDMNELMILLFGILGIGTMRTFEKVKGVSSDTIEDNAAAQRNVPSVQQQQIPPGFGPPPENTPWIN